jgi:predicted membrane metal-binding protein
VETSSVLRKNTRVSLLYYGEENPTLYDTITAKVRLHTTENETYSVGNGCFVRAFPAEYVESDMKVTGTTETAVDRWLHRVRLALHMVGVPALGRTESSILSAVCFGERAYLDAQAVEAFRVSGLSHLLVV